MAAGTNEFSVTATSPLGAVTLQVSGSLGIAVDVTQPGIPELWDGMAVDGVLLFRVSLAVPVTRESPLKLRATLGQEGSPESGEWLDSMAFTSGEGILQIAMRDAEWLSGKSVIAEQIHYELQGFKQVIREAPADSTFYIRAWTHKFAARAG